MSLQTMRLKVLEIRRGGERKAFQDFNCVPLYLCAELDTTSITMDSDDCPGATQGAMG